MVARGDLGVEVGDAELVGIQKRILQHARTLTEVVITATQMMESMISSARPTRAEVSDVANAVVDSTDAVLRSEEHWSEPQSLMRTSSVVFRVENNIVTQYPHHS